VQEEVKKPAKRGRKPAKKASEPTQEKDNEIKPLDLDTPLQNNDE
jgi:hypothetical protein